MKKTMFQATLEALQKNGKDVADITFIGTEAQYCTWMQFQEMASKIDAYDYHVGVKLPTDLVIMFKDQSWLQNTLDCEWGTCYWEYHKVPTMSINQTQMTSLY